MTRGATALRRTPDDPDLLRRAAVELDRQGAHATAESLMRRAIAMRETVPILEDLATLLSRQDRPEEALPLRQRTVALAPGSAPAWTALAQIHVSLERLQEARSALDTALRLDPELAAAHLARARLHFLEGDLLAGWPEFEWRFRSGGVTSRPVKAPLWQGEDLAGKRILVHAEQGMGDTLQFVRFLPRLAGAGARVLLGSPPPLHRLLGSLEGVETVLTHGARVPRIDFHCPMLSLPHRLRIDLDQVSAPVPYVTLPPARGRARLPPRGKAFRIGLVWAGNPRHTNDRNRSLPLESLLPLLGVPRTRFYSLQFGPRAGDIGRTGSNGIIRDLGGSEGMIQDFADTGALMRQLDLVVTVDTASAHLAGALGIETWLLLPPAPDWRWMLGRSDSPWYPTVRLFRRGREQTHRDFVTSLIRELETRI